VDRSSAAWNEIDKKIIPENIKNEEKTKAMDLSCRGRLSSDRFWCFCQSLSILGFLLGFNAGRRRRHGRRKHSQTDLPGGAA
jgi:hypothetical protein